MVVGGSGNEGRGGRELGMKIRDEQEKQIMKQNQKQDKLKNVFNSVLRLHKTKPIEAPASIYHLVP